MKKKNFHFIYEQIDSIFHMFSFVSGVHDMVE